MIIGTNKTRRPSLRSALTAGAALGALFSAGAALAQDKVTQVETIVITALKRPQAAPEAPASIEVLSGQALARGTLRHLHHIEPGADDAVVVAWSIGPRHRVAGRMERRDDPELAVYSVGRSQQAAWRLAAQNKRPRWRSQLVVWIGLPSLKLAHCQRAGIALDIGGHPPRESGLIEAMGRSHGLDPAVSLFALLLCGFHGARSSLCRQIAYLALTP